jgi:hypothetical protein
VNSADLTGAEDPQAIPSSTAHPPPFDTLKVDGVVAREVAVRFMAARSTPKDAQVHASYGQLEHQSDRAFLVVTSEQSGPGIRVVFTCCRIPYSSDYEMIAAVRAGHLLEVTTSAVDRDRAHPLLGSELGGAYDRFRAVHDIVGHVVANLGFDRDGEFGAWAAQERLYSGLAIWALATELHAEHSVRWTTGEVSDHKAILFDQDLLFRARQARRSG